MHFFYNILVTIIEAIKGKIGLTIRKGVILSICVLFGEYENVDN